MAEKQKNWDPGVKKFFLNILSSVSLGTAWLMTFIMAGIYYELAFFNSKPIYSVLFYAVMLISLILLVRYLIKIWKKES